jgi:adenylate kinase family enzyme
MFKNNTKNKLILVTGAPGSGKSTLIKELSKYITFSLIEADCIKDAIYGEEDRLCSGYRKIKGNIRAIINNLIQSNIQHSANVIVENTFWEEVTNPDWYLHFTHIIEEQDIKIIRCIVPELILFNRLKGRRLRRDENKIRTIDHFYIWLQKEPIRVKMKKGIEIDTTNLEEATIEAIKYIQEN